MPNLKLQKYIDVNNTVDNIKRLVEVHKTDDYLKVFDKMSLSNIFDYIKNLPFVPDPQKSALANFDNIELLKSPYFTLLTGGDCDDKTILAACIFERKRIPYLISVTSSRPDQSLHHIYLCVLMNDKKGNKFWLPFDATYKWNKLFKENPYTKKKIYDWNNFLLIYEANFVKPNDQFMKPPNACKNYLNKNRAGYQLAGNYFSSLNGVQLGILEGNSSPLDFYGKKKR